MRTESPLAPGATAAGARGAPVLRGRRGDVVAVVVLVMLPAVIFGLPAVLGHAVTPGDDLTQNFPLRVLAGQEIRAGHLPFFDPYIWSGAPLLAGWNAAAAYPLTWLFSVLPGAGAWTVNMIVTWAVAGLGMFAFLRALRLARLASFLGAFSFAFAGGMSAQATHFGLVAGLSWVPLGLLSILRLSQDRPLVSRLGWTAVLATALGLVILAGEPRAIDDACVILVIYAAGQAARLGRRAGPALASVTAGLALGVGAGAVQWLPGLAAIGSSQRGADSMALYSSGSLPVRWVLPQHPGAGPGADRAARVLGRPALRRLRAGPPEPPGGRARHGAGAGGGGGGRARLHLGPGLDPLGGAEHLPQRQPCRPAEAVAVALCGARRGRGRAGDLRAAARAEAERVADRRLRRRRRGGVHRPVRGRGRARPVRRL